ncbi:MAG TPA: hypothetical protein VGL19_22480, partial [Polyangiaceae bacterium]
PALLTAFASSLWFASGCGPGAATPMPEPPSLVDLARVGPPTVGAEAQSIVNGEAHEIDGDPGAVPGNAVVRVTNLDGTDTAYSTTAFSDGHFKVDVPVVYGNELRFEWVLGSKRSAPVDALFLKDLQTPADFQLQPSARFDCVSLKPGFLLDFATAQTSTLSLQIDNQCSTKLSIDSQSLRRMSPDFSTATTLPLSVPAGTSASLDIAYSRINAAGAEDTLFFNLTQGGSTIRYPVTLSADP